MNKKQGITVAMLTITIIILIILAGTITYSIYSTINYSNISTWISEMSYIQDIASEKLKESTVANFVGDSIYIDLTNIGSNEISEQFEGETISENKVAVQILDLEKLNVTNTMYGKLSTEKDVYAISQQTGRVYYVEGVELNNTTYFTATTSLKEKYNIQSNNNNLTTVVFVPSKTGYTKEAVSVTVKVPNTYTNVAITTTNSNILIGTRVAKEKTYEYLVNSNNIVGNYTITVSYNTGVQTLVSKYEVNSYDNTAPVISELTDANFIYKKTETDTTFYAINITATDNLGIKTLKYDLGKIALEDAENHFKDNGSVVYGGKINLDRTNEIYTIYAEDYAGNYSVLTFDRYDYVVITEEPPEKWAENISVIVNGVPIPKGFVASPYGADKENNIGAENKKRSGMVIYELTSEEVTSGATTLPKDETQFESWTSRAQYVWIPVDSKTFETTFVRKDLLNTTSKIYDEDGNYISLGTASSTWEVETNKEANMPLNKEETSDYKADSKLNFITEATILEAQAMYASVKEYGGFYIGRYEAGVDEHRFEKGTPELFPGILEGSKVYVLMGKIPYTYISWARYSGLQYDTGASVEICRRLYPDSESNKTGVRSTLTYGVQWDRVLNWWLETNAVSSVTKSNSYGNYSTKAINKKEDLNDGALVWVISTSDTYLPKEDASITYPIKTGTARGLSTGALKVAKVNNIYDLAGNAAEWVMEGRNTNLRVLRGGSWSNNGDSHPVAERTSTYPGSAHDNLSFRPSLYIKLPT